MFRVFVIKSIYGLVNNHDKSSLPYFVCENAGNEGLNFPVLHPYAGQLALGSEL